MERGPVTFAILFLILPVLLFVGAWLVPAYALLCVLIGLAVLVTGFTLALGVSGA
ncbi:MAG: hypothetical protein WDA16_15045 [Candidatus Thermoplasmatota archaeon]